MMADPNSQLLEALGLTASKYRSLRSGEKQSVQQLQEVLNGLTGDQLNSALSKIAFARVTGVPGGGQALSPQGLRGLLNEVLANPTLSTPTAPPTPSVFSEAGRSAKFLSGNSMSQMKADAAAGKPSDTQAHNTPVSPATEDEWSLVGQLTGLGADGVKAAYQAQSQAYLNAVARNPETAPHVQRPPDPVTWIASHVNNARNLALPGLSLLENQWVQQHGSIPIPDGLMQQWITELNASPALQQQIGQYISSYGTSPSGPTAYLATASLGQLIGPNSRLGQIQTDFLSLNPLKGQAESDRAANLAALRSSREQQWIKTFGTAPMPSSIASGLTSMNEEQFQQAIDHTPYMNGMTYGQYGEAKAAMTSQWNAAFGVDPTPGQIAWGVGKSTAEIKQHIDAQPSRIGGWNYGTYSSVITAGDKMSNDFFGHPLDDALLSEFSKQFNPAPKPKAASAPAPAPSKAA